MAAFEYCLKDYIAQLVDATDMFDEAIENCNWISVDKSRVLAQRDASARIGAILIHPLMGWQDAREVNQRYQKLFGQELLPDKKDVETIGRLWILRHTVAHNAGFLTHHDSYRLRAPSLREQTIRIDSDFLADTRDFLITVVRRMGDPVGKGIVCRWLRQRSSGDFGQDSEAYSRLKLIGTVVESRTQDLPVLGEPAYLADRAALAPQSL